MFYDLLAASRKTDDGDATSATPTTGGSGPSLAKMRALGPLGPEPRRQHRHPRDLPGYHPHHLLIHVACPVRVNGHHHDRVPAGQAGQQAYQELAAAPLAAVIMPADHRHDKAP